MKCITLLIISAVLILASIVLPKLLPPGSGSLVVVISRPLGMICFLIGLVRLSKGKKSKE